MVPFQTLQAYGLTVHAVCPYKRSGDICRTVLYHVSADLTSDTESRGHDFTLNATFDDIDETSYDALVIPGARAPEYLATIPSVVEMAKHFMVSGKPIAAICHASLIFAAGKVLRNRTLTAFPTLAPVLISSGAHWIEPASWSSCVCDGNLISGVTYEGHAEYIGNFIRVLGGTVTGFKKKILVLCGDYELHVPLQSLQALGCQVDTISPKTEAGAMLFTAIHEVEEGDDQTYSEKMGHEFKLTATFKKDFDASGYDGFVIPGGRAAESLAREPDVIKLVKYFMDVQKPVASIGLGPQILAAADVLNGKTCMSCPAVKIHVELAGGTWLEPELLDRCFTDGNLVTGAHWPALPQFVVQFMSLLGVNISF